MSARRARPVQHLDRALAVSDHAVKRARERAPSCAHLDEERVRLLLADAVRGCPEEPHYVPGQRRVRAGVLGHDVVIVLARDTTGWGASGTAVSTVLTPEMVARREED